MAGAAEEEEEEEEPEGGRGTVASKLIRASHRRFSALSGRVCWRKAWRWLSICCWWAGMRGDSSALGWAWGPVGDRSESLVSRLASCLAPLLLLLLLVLLLVLLLLLLVLFALLFQLCGW